MPFEVRRPRHGPTFDDVREGDVHVHPRGLTIHAALAQEFATTFLDANPLHRNEPYARAHGFDGLVVPPALVYNVALGLGVERDSERTVAYLGVEGARFFRPVIAGDTLRSVSKVLSKRDRGPGRPGVVTLRTAAFDQRDQLVLQYDRTVLLPRGEAPAAAPAPPGAVLPGLVPARDFPPNADRTLHLPRSHRYPRGLTGDASYADDLAPGVVFVHENGRTVTDEHYAWTARLGNTHPLHSDRLTSSAREGRMGGEPVVFGGLVMAWVLGLASRDTTENALFDVSWERGAHSAPVTAGDTLAALTRVLASEEGPPGTRAAAVTLHHVGVKGVRAGDALERHGEALFRTEADRRAAGAPELPEKVFELVRTVLVKRRPAD